MKYGYIRKAEDTVPEYECPKYVILYDKYNPKIRNSGTQNNSTHAQIDEARKVRLFIALILIAAGLVHFWRNGFVVESFLPCSAYGRYSSGSGLADQAT